MPLGKAAFSSARRESRFVLQSCISCTTVSEKRWSQQPLQKTGRNRKATRVGTKKKFMPKYLIERVIPGSGAMTTNTLQKIARKSCDCVCEIGPELQWVESFITADKWFCIHIAPNEDLIREHAQKGGFPANSIMEIMSIVNPVTAENGTVES